MHRLRERPRVVAFRFLGAALLLGAGVLIGVLVDRNDPKGSSASQARLVRAERGVRERTAFLTRTRDELRRLRSELDEARRRSRGRARITARLRRDLRRAERASHRSTKAAGNGNRSR